MIDADEDRERISNELADAKREMRANKARLVAGGDRTAPARRGTLTALPAAPKPAQTVASVGTVAAVDVAPQNGAGEAGFVPSCSFTQLLVAAALVAVLVAVWIVERRSSVADREAQDGR